MSSYALAVDLGTTYTAAAVFRDGQAKVVHLGQRSAAIPSVVFLRDDDTILTGETAVRRGVAEPHRLAREFKRRVGDPAPILLGGTPMSADALLARLLAWTVDVVAEREGGRADRVALCHPANWGPYKLDLLRQAARRAGVADAVLLSEPEAAAIHYASQERVEEGAVLAVYDLGGGTFDAAVLRKTSDGFEMLGPPEGIERLGGIDFDEAVLAHALRHVGDAVKEVSDDAVSLAALARLRQECIDAKEALSADSETSIPVMLPGLNTEVRITRAELESMIRVPLVETVAALRRALRTAGVEAGDLAAVLLVGGSSRIPMVAQMIGAETARPVAVDADPKHAVALGAALYAGRWTRPRVDPPVPAAVAAESSPPAVGRGRIRSADAGAPTEVPIGRPRTNGEVPGDREAAPGGTETAAAPAFSHGAPVTVEAALKEEGPGTDDPTVSDDAPSRPADAPVAPPTTAASPRRPPRRGVLMGAAVAVVVVAGVAAAVLLAGGGGDDAGGWVSPCPARPSVCITDVERSASGVRADFVANGVDLVANASGEELQAVFFLTKTDKSGAQSVDNHTAAWEPWGPRRPFEGFSGGTGSNNAICVLVGDGFGRVASDTGNCAQLPSS